MVSFIYQASEWLPLSPSTILLLLLPLYAIGWILYARCFHPLSRYPGPFLASISRLWMALQVKGARFEETSRQLHQKYGPFVRVAPNEVIISNPEAIKTIYSINSGFTKTDFYSVWRPAWVKYPDAFSSLDEREHASRRKIVNSIYSMSSITQSEESIEICTELLLKKMSKFAESGQVFDMAKWAQFYAFDVVGQLFFSRMFGFLESEGDNRGYIRSLDLLIPILTIASVIPTYMRTLFLRSGAAFPKVSQALKSLVDIENAADQCLAERQDLLQSGEALDKKDILAKLFEVMRNKGESVDFHLTEVKLEVYVALFAGSDTTAAAVSSILYHLMRSPSAYKRLTEEIDRASQAGELSVPAIRYQEAIKLPYLDACCKEGMRLHPSVGFHLPRLVPPGGCSILGQWFPEGSRVGINAAVVHRDKSIFGDDADYFRPERWLEEDAKHMERYMFQFGGGSRTCIGKNISLCEMYKMIPQLLLSFHLELVEPQSQWTTLNHWFHKPSNVQTRVKVRENLQ